MLIGFLLVLVVSSCLAQQDGDLDSLINDIFKPQGTTTQTTRTRSDLDFLINDIFKPQGTTTQTTRPRSDLDFLINDIFKPQGTTTQTTRPRSDLDFLINDIFKPQGTTTQTTRPRSDLDSLINDIFKPQVTTQTTRSYIDLDALIKKIFLQDSEDKRCVTEDGQLGECVPYYLCNANNKVVTNGANIIDVRSNLVNIEGERKINSATLNKFGSAVRYHSVRRENDVCESSIDVCCLPPSVPATVAPPVVPRESGCGIRNPQGVGFSIKGDMDNQSQLGEFPWMVAVLKLVDAANSSEKVNMYQCGGALIHPRVVLTAAHCVAAKAETSAPQLKIRVGEWDTQTKNEIYSHQDRNVAKIVWHEEFYAGGLFNDIALLFLETPVKEEDHVGTICLPPEGDYAPRALCVASGWGKDVFGKDGRHQVILKKIELPVVDHARCQASLRKTRLGRFFELDSSFICAGGEAGKDTCMGDGGSPLACPIPGYPERYMQSGIVAWGIGCGQYSTPGVYVNVAHLRQWIDDQLYLNNIDMTGYGDPL